MNEVIISHNKLVVTNDSWGTDSTTTDVTTSNTLLIQQENRNDVKLVSSGTQGKPGEPGPQGPPGPIGNEPDIPDLTISFENGLI